MSLTLTTDSDERKKVQLVAGLDGYFPAALVGVAKHSYKSNEKHNKGQPMHWSIDKSTDHAECIRRHLLDLSEMLADFARPGYLTPFTPDQILDEANALAWRALALSQTLHMQFAGAPMPFNARKSESEPEEPTIRLADFAGPIAPTKPEPYPEPPLHIGKLSSECPRCIWLRSQWP